MCWSRSSILGPVFKRGWNRFSKRKADRLVLAPKWRHLWMEWIQGLWTQLLDPTCRTMCSNISHDKIELKLLQINQVYHWRFKSKTRQHNNYLHSIFHHKLFTKDIKCAKQGSFGWVIWSSVKSEEWCARAGNTKGGSIIHCTIDLRFDWFGLDCYAKKIVSCHTANSKPVKQGVNGSVILPPLVFPEKSFRIA